MQVAVVNTVDPLTHISAPNRIAVKSPEGGRLDIALRRTVRVPDDGRSYNLPPNLGSFLLYDVNTYKDKLPVSVVQKGGFFMPIHDREAMFIQFASTSPFAIKIYSGGVNVISGESKHPRAQENSAMETEFTTKHSAQDHMVTPAQNWVDGIASIDGKVQQFVAASDTYGYSVEAQLTNATIHVALRLAGGRARLQGDRSSPLEALSLAPGGLINQVIRHDDKPSGFWDTSSSVTFNVQPVDANLCQTILGFYPLLPPVTAVDYSCPSMLPLYTLTEEPSGIFGNFPVRSLGQIDRARDGSFTKRTGDEHKLEKNLTFGSKPVGGSVLKQKSRYSQMYPART
ncbi:integral membrane protein [Rutstroemia sp. NJR-2017a BBW]|nr:integral membrane protein [Rutstroemia sp. NJR-2017a BBW]